MEKDFAETQVLCRLVVKFHEMVAKVRTFNLQIHSQRTDAHFLF